MRIQNPGQTLIIQSKQFKQQQQQFNAGDQFMSPNNPGGQFGGQPSMQQLLQQQQQQQQQMKNTPPPTMSPSPQHMVPPNASPQHVQQLMHAVRSPPPSSLAQTVRSPQPNPSPRLGVGVAAVPSPSPRQPTPSPRAMASHSPHPSMAAAAQQQQHHHQQQQQLHAQQHVQQQQQQHMDPTDSLMQGAMGMADQQDTPQDQLSKFVENL